MKTRNIAIVSLELDLHAHVIAKKLHEHFSCQAFVVAIDNAHLSNVISISNNSAITQAYDGTVFKISDLDVVWWRRANQPQQRSAILRDEETFDFVSSEWRFAYQSIFFDAFSGIWVNEPSADVRISSKSLQLRIAMECGMSVPDTLISNDYCAVVDFWNSNNGDVIVKKLAGAPGQALATVSLTKEMLVMDNIKLCPAIYQKKVIADHHLRVLALETEVLAVSIASSDEIDWRRNLNTLMRTYKLPTDVVCNIKKYLLKAGLRMGIFDFIVDGQGELFFLEVNPQGQFLFVEKLAHVDWSTPFAKFLSEIPSST